MRVADISFYYDDFVESEEELLRVHYTTVGWAEALQRNGVDVVVLKRFHRDASFVKNGVQYVFVKDKFKGELRLWQMPLSFLRSIARANADIVHLHSFPFSIPAFVLRILLPRKTGIVVQNHGGKVGRGFAIKILTRLAHFADAFFFTAFEQGSHWFKHDRLRKKVMPVMESCPVFDVATLDANRTYTYADRYAARKAFGLKGKPVFLWVGALDENKDPLTILNAFEVIFTGLNTGFLYMIYHNKKLIAEVEQRIAQSPALRNNVVLLGKVPRDLMVHYYSCADYFVLGSHYEGSGFALSESLSFGCVPVVTDIPSFRVMTDNGTLGKLWEAGNADALIAAVNEVLHKPLQQQAESCIKFYRHHLTFEAIALTAIEYYKKIMAGRLAAVND